MGILAHNQNYLSNLQTYINKDIEIYGSRYNRPENLLIKGSSIYFDEVPSASGYKLFVDDSYLTDVTATIVGRYHYFFIEEISIDDYDTEGTTLTKDFTSNGTSFIAFKIYGKDSSNYGIYYINQNNDEIKAFDGHEGWVLQDYRTVYLGSDIVSGTDDDLYTFLFINAIEKNDRAEIKLSDYSAWNSLSNTIHTISIAASGTERTSLFSHSVHCQKNFDEETLTTSGIVKGPYSVVRVVDGDTLVLNIEDLQKKIRLIGVNTPESVANESYGTGNSEEGKDASSFTKSIITSGSQVYIEFDAGPVDPYNRYLCYLYLNNNYYGEQSISNPAYLEFLKNNMLNAMLVRNGLAEAKYYSPNGAYRNYFELFEDEAKNSGSGFWGTGFFPTTLYSPVLSLNGTTLSWTDNNTAKYVSSFEIKIKQGSSIVSREIVTAENRSYDLASNSIISNAASGTKFSINIVANPGQNTHNSSKNSNTITFTK